MTGLHDKYKYLANLKPSWSTAIIQKQKHFTWTNVESYKVIKETKKEHYSRLTAKSNNTIKTTLSIIKKKWPEKCIQQNDEKQKHQKKKMNNTFDCFFLKITNIHHIQKEDAILFLEYSFPENFISITIISITEAEIPVYNTFP